MTLSLRHSLLLVVLVLLLTACSRSSRSARDPASGDLPFEALTTESVEARMREKYLKIEYTSLLAYQELAAFDDHLAREKSLLFDNPHYATLLAARMSIEEEHHEILELRDQFFQEALRPEAAPEVRSKALRSLRATLPPTRGALAHLVFEAQHRSMQQFTRRLLLTLESLDKRDHRAAFETLYQELAEHWGPLAPALEAPDRWRQRTTLRLEELRKDQAFFHLKRNLEHVAQDLRVSHAALESKSLAAIYPSPGRAGNIVGSEFPAKVWSLTFDDGPGSATTQKILDHLNRHGLRASFFQLTKNVRALPSVARQLREAGMEIASHSYTHQQLPKLSPEQRDREIRVAAGELGDISQRPMKFYRLPYGAGLSNADIRDRIARAQLIHVFWNVDTLDWMAQPPGDIVERTIKQMAAARSDAGVILFHDIHERTVVASEEIMRHLKKDQRRVCLLDEIVEAINAGRAPCAP